MRALPLVVLFASSAALADKPTEITLPQTPPELVAGVEKLRKIVDATSECYESHGERSEHTADRRCPGWYAQLKRGGRATAFAIGTYFHTDDYGDWAREETDIRLVELLSEKHAVDAVPFLIASLDIHQGRWWAVAGAVLEALPRLTGWDVVPLKPWEEDQGLDYGKKDKSMIEPWQAWYAAHGSETREQWVAGGLDHARKALMSTNPAVRFAAIKRLSAAKSDRPAALQSFADLLASDGLTAEPRAWMKKFVRRRGLKLPKAAAPATVEAAAPSTTSENMAAAMAPAPLPLPADPKQAAQLAWKRCQTSYYALRLEAALAACTQAVSLDPALEDARLGLGWVQLEIGDTAAASAAAAAAKKSASNDTKLVAAAQLEAAALTVAGKTDVARALLSDLVKAGKASADTKTRLALLTRPAVPVHWVKYLLPRYACWEKKGEAPAAAYLLRRGVLEAATFQSAVTQLDVAERDQLQERGEAQCPW